MKVAPKYMNPKNKSAKTNKKKMETEKNRHTLDKGRNVDKRLR
jgi:hypothetical protein